MLWQGEEAIYSLFAGRRSEISVEVPLPVKVNSGGTPARSTLSTIVYHVSGHSNDSHPLTNQNTTINYCIWAAVIDLEAIMHTTITITYPGGDHETTTSHDIGRGMRRLPTTSQTLVLQSPSASNHCHATTVSIDRQSQNHAFISVVVLYTHLCNPMLVDGRFHVSHYNLRLYFSRISVHVSPLFIYCAENTTVAFKYRILNEYPGIWCSATRTIFVVTSSSGYISSIILHHRIRIEE